MCLRLTVEETETNCGFVLLQLNMQNIIIELQREVEENKTLRYTLQNVANGLVINAMHSQIGSRKECLSKFLT